MPFRISCKIPFSVNDWFKFLHFVQSNFNIFRAYGFPNIYTDAAPFVFLSGAAVAWSVPEEFDEKSPYSCPIHKTKVFSFSGIKTLL